MLWKTIFLTWLSALVLCLKSGKTSSENLQTYMPDPRDWSIFLSRLTVVNRHKTLLGGLNELFRNNSTSISVFWPFEAILHCLHIRSRQSYAYPQKNERAAMHVHVPPTPILCEFSIVWALSINLCQNDSWETSTCRSIPKEKWKIITFSDQTNGNGSYHFQRLEQTGKHLIGGSKTSFVGSTLNFRVRMLCTYQCDKPVG